MFVTNEKMSNENYQEISTRNIIHELKKIEKSGKEIHGRYTEKENYAILDTRGFEGEYWNLSIEFDTWTDFGLALEELESTHHLWHIDIESGYYPLNWDMLAQSFPYTIFRSENGPITILFVWQSEDSRQRESERK
tara:strand:- start:21 stop:428 length:408 start_codon:yes stop_codon:yes gene_type:complete